jgi:hypothetical protein
MIMNFIHVTVEKKMQNKWKTRYRHVKSLTHNLIVKENHLLMIKNNPKYEVSIIDEYI